jgi:hypothetical protein
MDAARREVLALAGRCLAWLPVMLAAWYFASNALAWVPVQAARPALAWAGVEVRAARLAGGVATFDARLRMPYSPGPAAMQDVDVAIEVNTRTFTFGTALFLALAAGLGRPWRPGRIALGAAIVVALPAWSIAFDALRQLAGVRELAPYLAWSPALREAIAFGYQAGSLLLPTLGPVALWVALNPQVARRASEEDEPGRQ